MKKKKDFHYITLNFISYGYCCIRVWIHVLFAACLVSAASAQTPGRLWVLQEPDEIVEYDIATFAARRTLQVPRLLIEHPEYVSINAKGQILFFPPKDTPEMVSTGCRVWFWDGHREKGLNREDAKTLGDVTDNPPVIETTLQCYLTAGGESLFWFENRFEKVTDEDGMELSVRSTSRVWRTDLAGGRPETITHLFSSGWCRCATGVCSETCPEWYFWAPDGVVADCFVATRVTPGQLGTTYHESLLYRPSGRTWQAEKLPQPLEKPLTVSEDAGLLVVAVPDGGCCSWDNESSDQMLLQNGKVSLFYDEFDRYGNRDYDVSFYTADARLSTENTMLAYTVVSTVRNAGEIPLSSGGRVNAEELARIRRVITELPAVEIVQAETQRRPIMTIRHASLVGWVRDREILVAQDGRLVFYDISSGKRKETMIRVRSAADAFLR